MNEKIGSNELKHDAETGKLEVTLDDLDLGRFLDSHRDLEHLRRAYRSRGLLRHGFISIPFDRMSRHHLIPVSVEMERDGSAVERVTMYLSPTNYSDLNQRSRTEIAQIHSDLAAFIASQTTPAQVRAEHREDRYSI